MEEPTERLVLQDNVVEALILAGFIPQSGVGVCLTKHDVALLETPNTHIAHVAAISLLAQSGIFSAETVSDLNRDPKHAVSLFKGLSCLKFHHILTPENRLALINNLEHADSMTYGFGMLVMTGIMTPENRAILLNHVRYAENLGIGFSNLVNAELFTEENRNILINHAINSDGIGKAFSLLQSVKLLTPDSFKVLIEHASSARYCADVFEILMGFELLIEMNVSALFKQIKHSSSIDYAVKAMLIPIQEIGLNQDTLTEILNEPKKALIYAEEHGGKKWNNNPGDNLGADDYVRIRSVSRLMFWATKSPESLLGRMPPEILTTIASYCGENKELDADTCDTIAQETFPDNPLANKVAIT